MEYEINYLVLQSKTAELPEIRKEAKTIIESYGGKIVKEREYLKRKLAYEIKHELYGFYTVLRFELSKKEKIEDLKKELNINNNICRYIIVRADELPALETPIVKEEQANAPATEEVTSVEEKKAVEEETEKKEEAKEVKEVKEIAKKEKKAEEPKEEAAEIAEEKVEKKKVKSKKEDDDKTSLEDLDKKLDEILNI